MQRLVLSVLAVTGLGAGSALAIVPVNGTPPTLSPVTINAWEGDQTDPHVSGEWASYTDNVSVRYYNFVSTADAQIPMGASARDTLSDVSGSKIVFSRTIIGVKTAVMVFDAMAGTAPVELDPAGTVTRLGSAIGGNTVAYVDLGLHANGELVIHDLLTSTSMRITSDAAFDTNPSVSPSGTVVVWEHCATSMGNCDIWQAERAGTSWTVSVVNDSLNPEGNPDTNGTLVAYDSQRAGNSDIFWRPVAGGAEVQLQTSGLERNPSMAGNFIVFESQASALSCTDLFLYDVSDNRLYQMTDTPLVNEQLNDVALLADGRLRVVWASDEAGFDVRNIKGVTFSRPGCPVVVRAGPDQTVDEGVQVELDGCGSTAALYTWIQLAGPTAELLNANACNASFTAPPVPTGGAVLTFILHASTGIGSNHCGRTETVDVTVKNVNQAPVTAAGDDQQVNEGTTVTLDGSSTFDPDGEPLTYTWAQNAGAPVTLSDPGAVRPTFAAPLLSAGSEVLSFELTVSDGIASATDEVQVTVENVNHPPAAAAGNDHSGTIGAVVTLDGSASADPDGESLTYLWTLATGPAVSLTGEDQAVATFIPTDAGTYVFNLAVTDPGTLTGQDQVTIVVAGLSEPPACDVARATVTHIWPPNHKMADVGIAGVTDPDGDAVTITIVSVRQDEPVSGLGDGDTSPDAVLQRSTVLLRAERAGSGNGRYYHVAFRAEDAAGDSCTGTVKVFVPRDMRKPVGAVDGGPGHDSTLP